MTRFVVIESTPGYLPDDPDPLVTDDYGEAVAEAHRLANELQAQGYRVDRGCASSDNLLAIHAVRRDADTVAPDLGRWIAIEIDHEEDHS